MARKKRQRAAPRVVADAGAKPRARRRISWTLLVLWAMLWLPPVVFSRRVEESFRLPKLLLSEFLAVFSILLLAERLRRVERVDLRAWLRRPVVLAVGSVLLAATVGLATTDHPDHVRGAMVSLWVAGAALVAWACGLETQELRRLIRGLVGPGVALSLLVIVPIPRPEPLRVRGGGSGAHRTDLARRRSLRPRRLLGAADPGSPGRLGRVCRTMALGLGGGGPRHGLCARSDPDFDRHLRGLGGHARLLGSAG